MAIAALTIKPRRLPDPSTLSAVLCVDDEQAVLDGISRNLRNRYRITTATSGADALELLASSGPFAVILSDMRMPGMSGAELLSKAHKLAPDTVRMLLTGHSDLKSTISAVNDGHIFRYLTKPCGREMLSAALDAGVEQYRLVTAERELLEQTLRGSVQALIDTVALVNPELFARAMRLRRRVAECYGHIEIVAWWQVEMAAMLSWLGAVTVPDEVLERLETGAVMAGHELEMTSRIPDVTDKLLANIPRLEPVREIIRSSWDPYDQSGTEAPTGARLLHIIRDHDQLEARGMSAIGAADVLSERLDSYDPKLLSTFVAIIGSGATSTETFEIEASMLTPGMVLATKLVSQSGQILVSQGQEVTELLIRRICNLQQAGTIDPGVRVWVKGSAPTADTADS